MRQQGIDIYIYIKQIFYNTFIKHWYVLKNISDKVDKE